MLKRIAERKGHNGSIYQLIGPRTDGSFLSCAGDGWLVNWPAATPELGTLLAKVEGGQLFSAHLLPERNALVAGAMDGGLHWLFPEQPEQNLHLAHHRKGIYAITQIGQFLYCAGGDGVLSKWSVNSGRVVESLPLTDMALRSLAYDPRRKLLFVGSSNYHIYAIDPDQFVIRYQWLAHENSVFCLCITPDQRYLLSGGRDAHLKRWELNEDGLPRADRSLPAHNFTINDMAISPTGDYLVTVSRDKTCKLWRTEDLTLLKVAEGIRDRGHVNSVNSVIWLDEQRFLTASDDRRILEWEIGEKH